MPIYGLSERRRLPRMGKIFLGIKKDTKKDGTPCAPYPTEVEYFVCPPEVQKVFGEKPKALRIMFPVESEEIFFSQWYKHYGMSALLKCKGDGRTAYTWDENTGALIERTCPCERLDSKECKQVGILQFLLPDVAGAGVWQISTSSKNSIIDINSGLGFIRAICGRVAMIPLILKREKMEMQRVEGGKPKKSTHYTLKLDLDSKTTLRQLQKAAQRKPEEALLPPPPDETKPEDLYPPNGFAPDEPKPGTEPEPAQEKTAQSTEPAPTEKEDFKLSQEEVAPFGSDEGGQEIDLLKHRLADAITAFRDAGGKMEPYQENQMARLKTAKKYQETITWFITKTAELKEGK